MRKLQTFAMLTAGLMITGFAQAGEGKECEKVCSSNTKEVVNAEKSCDASKVTGIVNVSNTEKSCDASKITNVVNTEKSCDASKTAEVVNAAYSEKSCDASKVTEVVNSESKKSCEAACASKVVDAKQIVSNNNEEVEIIEVQYAKEEASSTAPYKLGQKINDFTATLAHSGEDAKLSSVAGSNGTVLIFWNQNCPWCVGDNGAEEAIESFATSYKEQGISVVYVDAGVNNNMEEIKQYAIDKPEIPLFINRDSTLAAEFNAKYTPHTFILDKDMNLVYRGAFYTGKPEARLKHAENAVLDIINNREVTEKEAVGKGCSIKWAEGARPTT